MTDNEIIKALKCCDADEEPECPFCPYKPFESTCTHLLAQDAIALIKSLQEDNTAKDETINNLIEQIKTFRADANKRFSDRLKRHIEVYEHAEDLLERQAYENGDTAARQIHQYAEHLLGHLLEYIEELERENEDNH